VSKSPYIDNISDHLVLCIRSTTILLLLLHVSMFNSYVKSICFRFVLRTVDKTDTCRFFERAYSMIHKKVAVYFVIINLENFN